MKQKLLLAAASVAMLATPAVAFADDDAGVYVRGNLGYGIHTDMDITGDMVGDVESEGNATGSVGVGYDFGNNWRLEGDLASLWTDLGAISQVPSSYAKLQTNTAMLNAIYDFDDFGKFKPYVGAGIGVVKGQLSAQAHSFTDPTGVGFINTPVCTGGAIACGVKDTDRSLGWQLLAGLGYDISDKLTWDTHYRYLNAGDLDFTGHRSLVPGIGNQSTVSLEDVAAHSVMTGFRYKFGASTPPVMYTCWNGSSVKDLSTCPEQPAPPPAPVMFTCWDGSQVSDSNQCPAEIVYTTCWDGSQVASGTSCPAQPATFTCWDGTLVYDEAQCPLTDNGNSMADLCGQEYRQEIIYYEFNKGQSAETRNTVNRILDIGQFCQVGDIRVVGHTDSSGSAAYNLGLSKRRAKDARDELVRQGVRSEVITSEGKGETELFVQTGDGVKEQLNRRTEVLIRLNQVGQIMGVN